MVLSLWKSFVHYVFLLKFDGELNQDIKKRVVVDGQWILIWRHVFIHPVVE